jgi:hypothetical protein
MKGARLISCSTLTQGMFLFSGLVPSDLSPIAARQVGIRWTMGRHRHDDRISDTHVLPVDMSLVL